MRRRDLTTKTADELLALRRHTHEEWMEDSTIDASFAMPRAERDFRIQGYRDLIAEIDNELERRKI